MNLTPTVSKIKIIQRFAIVFLLASTITAPWDLRAQSASDPAIPAAATEPRSDSDFRIETIHVAGGAELITIFADRGDVKAEEMPLVSILRDTLGDELRENDRLRYVWMLTYTQPSFWQKATAFVPFLYTRTTNKNKIGGGPPPPIADMRGAHGAIWNILLWTAFKNLMQDELGLGAKLTASQYRRNSADYKRAAVARALAVLSLYQTVRGEQLLSDVELKDVQARLWLMDKPLGWHLQSENLDRFYEKQLTTTRDIRGHNWELLRQYTEAQGLYFEPMEMPDGSARHAIVWTAADDLTSNQGRTFDGRFLNIKNPWNDSKLLNWKGYSQVRWFDEENRVVASDTPNARPRTMIPLAIYGLDHPKIPILLVDFRDNGNPKRREMSKRILGDITGSALALSEFSSFPIFMGRFVYDFVTDRRGMDINQSSRLRSYAQLKLLLSLDASLDMDFRNEVTHRLESVSLNPLENATDVEAMLARIQYKNLIDYARRPDGLPAQLDRERREEMVRLAHSGKERIAFDAAHFLTLGRYTHREKATPELVAQMDLSRQLDFHERVLREIAFRSADPEVDSDLAALHRSLQFISESGSAAKEKTTLALAKIFAISGDEDIRRLCLAGLYRVDHSSAKKELLAIYKDPAVDSQWRNLCAQYLKRALVEGKRIAAGDAATIAGIAGN